MQKIENMSFRDMYHQVAFIGDNFTIENLMTKCNFPGEKRNGVLVYGYIDVDAGFTFEILCNALKAGDSIKFYPGNEEITVKLRRESVSDCEIDIFDINEFDDYEDKISMVNEGYTCDENLSITRDITIIDECRHNDHPDDILVYIATEESQPEGCWVRCKRVDNNSIVGILLNEPNQDLGIHCGDEIAFGVMKQGDRNICVSLL